MGWAISARPLRMFQAIRSGGGTPMVRVPTLEPSIISRVLDAGALGVICPMINTADEAKQLVSYVRYAAPRHPQLRTDPRQPHLP